MGRLLAGRRTPGLSRPERGAEFSALPPRRGRGRRTRVVDGSELRVQVVPCARPAWGGVVPRGADVARRHDAGRARTGQPFPGRQGAGTRGSVPVAPRRAPPAPEADPRLGTARAPLAAPVYRRRSAPGEDFFRRGSRVHAGTAAGAGDSVPGVPATRGRPRAASSRSGARGPRDSRGGRKPPRPGGGPPSTPGSLACDGRGPGGARLARRQQTTSRRGAAARGLAFAARGLDGRVRAGLPSRGQASGGRVSTQRTACRISAVASRSPSFSFR